MRYRIILSYDGASFCGWQMQPDRPSIQEALQTALGILLKCPVSITGAGRTDTSVNAWHYVAHFDTASAIPDCEQLRYRLNAILPESVCINSIAEAASDFHSRFDATRREYTYFLHRCKDPFVAKYSYFYAYPGLDFERMNRAARELTGRHDFACFEKSGSDTKTSVCTVYEAFWAPYTPVLPMVSGIDSAGCRDYWYFRISADRFLRNMVRAVVGTLLEIGRGKRDAGSISELVGPSIPDGAQVPKGGTRRSLSGESVPGHALFLSRVDY
ncbi:MAG: tRNA pseudouridine(38-40) synthase TruA [Candidatus Cryptobacteroides sp.]|nr:tRNA pseudouridine(38-40) synthase TruA [Candidatus Cryptobacteroides sp.]